MRTYDPNEALISIHLAKSGGTSFRLVLEQWFGPRLHPHYFDRERNAPPPRVALEPGICIHGHFNAARKFGVSDYYPEARQFITQLRDPFDRVVSLFFYMRRNPDILREHGRMHFLDPGYTFETYLREFGQNDDVPLPFGPTLANFREIIDEHFLHVGLTEDLQGSVDRLADRLGKPRVTVPIENASKEGDKDPDTERLRQEYERSHPLQYAVYRHVQSMQRG